LGNFVSDRDTFPQHIGSTRPFIFYPANSPRHISHAPLVLRCITTAASKLVPIAGGLQICSYIHTAAYASLARTPTSTVYL